LIVAAITSPDDGERTYTFIVSDGNVQSLKKFLKMLNMHLSYDPDIPHQALYPTGKKIDVLTKTGAHSNFISNSQSLEIIHMSIKR
jgi:hypothetical protein